MTRRLEIWGVAGIGEVTEGDDLAGLVAAAEPDLRDGDVVVVTSKVVSKAEGRLVAGDRDEAITAETVRVVAERGDTRIVETRHGLVLAAAGVDASNVPAGTVALLPVDPDASARRIREGLRHLLGVGVGVVITDTMGRPWRNGLVDVAIGAAGVQVLDDHRGRTDGEGRTLEMTVTAVADEIASAAELVKGKLDAVPVAVVRGLPSPQAADDAGAAAIIRPAGEDLFRLGTREAMRQVVLDRRTAGSLDRTSVDDVVVRRAVAAALHASALRSAIDGEPSVRFVAVRERSSQAAAVLPAALRAASVLLVPCLPTDGTTGSATALLAAGAAVEDLLVALTADGVDTAWVLPGEVDDDVLRAAVALPPGWQPLGVVALGRDPSPRVDTAAPGGPPDDRLLWR